MVGQRRDAHAERGLNVNDRIALEIGRAKLAQILAEQQRDEALAKLEAAQAAVAKPEATDG